MSFANEDEYIIGVEDVLQVSFFSHDNLNTTATVRPDGMIMLPIIGNLKAADITPSELSEKISIKLSDFIKDVQVTIQVVEFKSKKIYIFGQVRNPGKLGFASIPSLIEVLIEAGGLAPDADNTKLSIIPKDSNKAAKIVNLEQYFKKGDTSSLPQLNSGDTIYVPAVKAPTPEDKTASSSGQEVETPGTVETQQPGNITIHVMGQVGRTGPYEFTGIPTIAEVLTTAGGVPNSHLLKKVRVVRSEPPPGRMFTVDMKTFLETGDVSLLPRLQSGDVIYVPETGPVEQMKKHNISILGAINSPGSYAVDIPVSLLDAITMAGGLTPDADQKRITITRETPEFFQTREIDIENLRSEAKPALLGKEEQPESSLILIQPGDSIYVPLKRSPIATITRGGLTFLRDLLLIYSAYRVVVR